MDGCFHFSLITLKTFTLSEKTLFGKTVSFLYNAYWKYIFTAINIWRNTFHISTQTHGRPRGRQSVLISHWNKMKKMFLFKEEVQFLSMF